MADLCLLRYSLLRRVVAMTKCGPMRHGFLASGVNVVLGYYTSKSLFCIDTYLCVLALLFSLFYHTPTSVTVLVFKNVSPWGIYRHRVIESCTENTRVLLFTITNILLVFRITGSRFSKNTFGNIKAFVKWETCFAFLLEMIAARCKNMTFSWTSKVSICLKPLSTESDELIPIKVYLYLKRIVCCKHRCCM